jgi:RNA polymerase sigma-70 factor, ECF subfamily
MMTLTMEAKPSVDGLPLDPDARLLAALRRGDEAAFVTLVDRYHDTMVRLATGYVRDRAVAEEVAQEAWLGVLEGLSRFEGRASLKTWIFRIVINTAKTRGVRESRCLPFSAFIDDEAEIDEPTVDPSRFKPTNHHWATRPESWDDLDEQLSSQAALAHIETALAELPERQRLVITLRDIQEMSAEEVCLVLDISETNQRVLLHRARAKVRSSLARFVGKD